MFSQIIPFKQTQTVVLTFLFFLCYISTTLLLRRFLIFEQVLSESERMKMENAWYISERYKLYAERNAALFLAKSRPIPESNGSAHSANSPGSGSNNVGGGRHLSNRNNTQSRNDNSTSISSNRGKYSSERAAREWSTVVDISMTPPSFKPVSLPLSRISSILKQPKQVFF